MILTRQTLTITAGSFTEDVLEVVSLSHPYGHQWGQLICRLPRSAAFAESITTGVPVQADLGDRRIFSGVLVQVPQSVDGNNDNVELSCLDVRFVWSGRRIGQRGTGDLHEQTGAWRDVGFRVHFNPNGRSNMAPPGDEESEEEEARGFDSSAAALPWTRKEILRWIVAWYLPELTVDFDELAATWDEPQWDFFAYGMEPHAAITKLAAAAGEAWSIAYDGEQILYVSIRADEPGPDQTFVLRSADSGQTVAGLDRNAVLRAEVTRSVADSVDLVEVHTNRQWIESCLSTHEAAGYESTVALTVFDPKLQDFVAGYRMDVTRYEAAKLGYNLPAGSVRKRWRRELNSRYGDQADETLLLGEGNPPEDFPAPDGAAGHLATLKRGGGQPIYAEQCIWIRDPADPEYKVRHVKSGFRILLDQATLLMRDVVECWDGYVATMTPGVYESGIQVWITVVTEIELETVKYNTPSSYHLGSAAKMIREMVTLTDLHPKFRYRSVVPQKPVEGSTTGINAVYRSEIAELTNYISYDAEMEAVAVNVLATRSRAEVTVSLQMVDIPVVVPGGRLVIQPANAGLSGTEVVTHYEMELGRDTLMVHATNNIARLITGDL